jgi:hypothetical protein
VVIELNIGLNIRGSRNSLADCGERAIQAINYLREQFGGYTVQTRRAQVQYEGPNGLELEDTLIARIEMSPQSVAARRLPYLIFRMAQNLGQDCIALYNETAGTGRLIGPEASAWGSFDLDYFTPFYNGYASEQEAA